MYQELFIISQDIQPSRQKSNLGLPTIARVNTSLNNVFPTSDRVELGCAWRRREHWNVMRNGHWNLRLDIAVWFCELAVGD